MAIVKNAKHRHHVIRISICFADQRLPAHKVDHIEFHTATMRPVTRLPLREALYVCSSCRQEAVPRVSPLARQFQHQTRRYASDSPSFLDRTRRKLWNSEKPPGAADPYTGDSQLSQQSTAADGELAGGETSELAKGDNYVQAETWAGLAKVGYLPEQAWIQVGRSKADKLRRYVLNSLYLIYGESLGSP